MKNNLTVVKNIFLSPIFIGIILFLFLQLQLFNLDFNYRDEGYLLNNAQRINNGEMPYADFSLALTPGSFYIQAFIMRIFGNYVLTDRIFYILCTVLVLVLSSKMFKFNQYLNYVFLISLGIINAGNKLFASYNIEGLIFIIIALLLFNKFKSGDNRHVYSFLIGLTNSITFLIKQSYGGIFFLTFLILIIIFTRRRYLFKNLLFYFLGNLILLCFFFLFFYFNGELHKLIYGIIYFALSVKNDRMPFILTSLLFIPFFAFIFNFVKKFSVKRLILSVFLFLFFFVVYVFISPSRIHYIFYFYKDPTIYYFLFFFVVPLVLINLFLKSKNEQKKRMVILSIEAISLFLASAFSGRDYTTVIVAAPLYIPLFLYLFTTSYGKLKLPLNNLIITLLIILFIFPSILSLLKTYGRLYGIGYKKETYVNLNVKGAKGIKIPINQKNDLELVVNYIKNITSPNDKLLCVPYCALLYFLSERNNASYFGFFYRFKAQDQERVIEDINNSKNITILIQKNGLIEKEASYEDKNLSALKRFIADNYKLVKTTQNFYIYNDREMIKKMNFK